MHWSRIGRFVEAYYCMRRAHCVCLGHRVCVVRDLVDPVADERLANFVVNSHINSHPRARAAASYRVIFIARTVYSTAWYIACITVFYLKM